MPAGKRRLTHELLPARVDVDKKPQPVIAVQVTDNVKGLHLVGLRVSGRHETVYQPVGDQQQSTNK